jgi:lipoprotein NlpD
MGSIRQEAGNPRILFYLFFMVLILGFLTSCSGSQVQKSQAKGVYHVVKKGETAFSIARAYSINLQDLAEVNNIRDISALKEGEVIFVPDADQVIDDVMVRAGKAYAGRDASPEPGKLPPDLLKPGEKTDRTETPAGPGPLPAQEPHTVVPAPKAVEKPSDFEKQGDIKPDKDRFIWPVKGVVKSRFGIQPDKTYHNWIKIICPPGARIKAAASGTVIFSAGLKDFGETVIIRHAGDFATVYTHLKKRQVKADRNVKKGDLIALAGEKDDTGDTYVNFEIRIKGKARNPLFYLP